MIWLLFKYSGVTILCKNCLNATTVRFVFIYGIIYGTGILVAKKIRVENLFPANMQKKPA